MKQGGATIAKYGPKKNKEGYNDPTAYEALKPVELEENRVSDFIKAIKILARLCGLEIVSWVEIKVKKTGRTY